MDSSPNGLLLIDKAAGWTSHDAVARTRRVYGTRKVGHAGTLDPMATGLLILGLGASTRLLTFVVGAEKEYVATIRLGSSTTTDDAEGEVLGHAPVGQLERVTEEDWRQGILSLTGEIEQVPSTVSAIKVGGKRAYALARAGETVELKPRPVVVSAFEVMHAERGIDENLNSPGAHFVPLAFAQQHALPDLGAKPGTAAPNRFYMYGVVARLALLAASLEIERTDPNPEEY